jgi:hypothetical protein
MPSPNGRIAKVRARSGASASIAIVDTQSLVLHLASVGRSNAILGELQHGLAQQVSEASFLFPHDRSSSAPLGMGMRRDQHLAGTFLYASLSTMPHPKWAFTQIVVFACMLTSSTCGLQICTDRVPHRTAHCSQSWLCTLLRSSCCQSMRASSSAPLASGAWPVRQHAPYAPTSISGQAHTGLSFCGYLWWCSAHCRTTAHL